MLYTPVNGCALLLAIRRSRQYRIIPTPLYYEPEWRTTVRDSISEPGITFDTSGVEHYTPGDYSLPYIIVYGIVYAFLRQQTIDSASIGSLLQHQFSFHTIFY